MKDTTIHKCRKSVYYSKISNDVLQDKRLSFKARGLLAYILSLPDDWFINVEHLDGESPQGREAIYSALRELAEYGYMKKEMLRNEHGQIEGRRWVAYDDPSEPNQENPDHGQLLTEADCQTTKETKVLKRKEGYKDGEALVKSIEIYNLYPRKVGRPIALRAINKAISAIGYEELKKHVMEYAAAVATWPVEQKHFIPHPATWINNERWNDDRSEWQRKPQFNQQKSFTPPAQKPRLPDNMNPNLFR